MNKMEIKQVMKNVKKVELKTKKLVEGLLQGNYLSVFKGRGVEFSDIREYHPGDDIRMIDWNVTARMNTPFVKEFIEERDLTLYIAFDMSASCEFGSERAKKDSAIEMAASIMIAAMNNNDKVGLLLFTDKAERYFPPRKGRKHMLRMIREMIVFQGKSKRTDIQNSLRYLSKVAKQKSIMFVISDFFDDGFAKSFKLLQMRHDVIAINYNDIREHEIPDVGYIELEDEETGEQMLVDTSDPDFREEYSSLVIEKHLALKNTMSRLGIDYIHMTSDKCFSVPLQKFFRLRSKRMQRR